MHKILLTISFAVMSYNLHAAQNQQPIQVEQKVSASEKRDQQVVFIDLCLTTFLGTVYKTTLDQFHLEDRPVVICFIDKIKELLPHDKAFLCKKGFFLPVATKKFNITSDSFKAQVRDAVSKPLHIQSENKKFELVEEQRRVLQQYADTCFALHLKAKALLETNISTNNLAEFHDMVTEAFKSVASNKSSDTSECVIC